MRAALGTSCDRSRLNVLFPQLYDPFPLAQLADLAQCLQASLRVTSRSLRLLLDLATRLVKSRDAADDETAHHLLLVGVEHHNALHRPHGAIFRHDGVFLERS